MIKNIQYLRNFGIFRDYPNSQTKVKDFEKYNLFYGWNGSGKSTLSTFFHCIENKEISSEFPSAAFMVNLADDPKILADDPKITQENIGKANLNIRTFNRDFIDKNISWDGIIEKILLIGEARIDEHRELKDLKREQESDCRAYKNEVREMRNSKSDISEFEDTIAKRIKDKFQSIDANDDYYLNYDKTKLKQCISKNFKAIHNNEFILKDSERVELMNVAKPDQKIAIDALVEKHNRQFRNFEEKRAKAKERLELYFVATKVKGFKYYEKRNDIVERICAKDELRKRIKKRKSKLRTLEYSLSKEAVGAKQFNESLCSFLGHGELILRFNRERKGYEMVRNDSGHVKGNLSEGEKTAISFVYFITKLKEKNNKIENTIVVVDDPVSSFDSNHLFHAYSFLKKNCNKPKQIFVLTHNFIYFKLIRDWFKTFNSNKDDSKNKDDKKKPKEKNASFYTIEVSTSSPRHSTIKDAHLSLVNYKSEYHNIFSRLHAYKDNPTLSIDDAFLTANLARRLLETFLSFKFPKFRRSLELLMNRGLEECKETDETKKERIYLFVNKYSHSVGFEADGDSYANFVGENKNVISDIFTWIEELDKAHYDEMIEVANQSKPKPSQAKQ